MKPIHFHDQHAILGKPSNWDDANGPCDGLPIVRMFGCCISYWKPTWKERLGLLFGHKIQLSVRGDATQPPVSLQVCRIDEDHRSDRPAGFPA